MALEHCDAQGGVAVRVGEVEAHRGVLEQRAHDRRAPDACGVVERRRPVDAERVHVGTMLNEYAHEM